MPDESKKATMFERGMRREYEMVSKLEQRDIENAKKAIERMEVAQSAERMRTEFKDINLKLQALHQPFLALGLVYNRANFCAREYQSIIFGYEASRAKYRMAIEWIKVAVDLTLLAATLGATNLYRLALPRLAMSRPVVRGVAYRSVARQFICGVPRTGMVQISRILFQRAIWPLNKITVGMVDKAILFSIPMYLLKKPAEKVAKWAIPLWAADWAGATDNEFLAENREAMKELTQSLPQPSKSLVKFDDRKILVFFAKVDNAIDDAVASDPRLKSLDPEHIEEAKVVMMMDFWLNVRKQVASRYVKTRGKIQQLEKKVRKIPDLASHQNWLDRRRAKESR